MGFSQALLAQESILKSYADSTRIKEYCFYPSTLRMLNLAKSDEFNDLVTNIEKLLIYTLDSTAAADKSYRSMLNEYQATGFEELATMTGGKTNLQIYGKDTQVNELTGIIRTEEDVYAFYLLGDIDWVKIPAMIQNFNESDVLNIFSLKNR